MTQDEKNVIAESADQAVELERQAAAEQDVGSYTHTFKRPFAYRDIEIKQLTFDWGSLTGRDHLDIETELLMRGRTLITPEYTSDFLWSMAVRACTERDGNGARIMRKDAVNVMPIRDFQVICKRARGFLLRAGS